MGSIAPSGVQKLFSTMPGSRDISKSKWGIRFQKYQILDNLTSWILMSHIVLLIFRLLIFYRNGFELEAWLRMSHLNWDMPKRSKLEKLCVNLGGIRFKEIRMIIISNSWYLITRIVLPISQLPDTVQKRFCTPDGDMDPTFQMNYIPVF